MTHSSANQPDLDWSQVRETIKLLTISVALVEGGLKVGDESVSVLASSFTSMVDDMNTISGLLKEMEAGETRDKALELCLATEQRICSSIVAFQFYDRLQQCLQHVSLGLKELSDLIDAPHRLYNPHEWNKFQQEIRQRYTMESEKQMFDAILHGKTLEQALSLVNQAPTDVEEDDIELF